MSTFPVQCPLAKIATRFTVGGGARHAFLDMSDAWCQGGQVGVSGCSVWRHMVGKDLDYTDTGGCFSPVFADVRSSEIGLEILKQNTYASKWSSVWSEFLAFRPFFWNKYDKWSGLSQTRRFMHINQKLLNYLSLPEKHKIRPFCRSKLSCITCSAISKIVTLHQIFFTLRFQSVLDHFPSLVPIPL